MILEQNTRWSPDDDHDKLKAFYCLYHVEVMGYPPSWIPLGATKDWFIDQLQAFDWYTNTNNSRDKALDFARANKQDEIKRTIRKKPSKTNSPFEDETKE